MQKNIERIVNILELEYNYSKSASMQSCIDKDNNPIPWFTYPAIFYLDQLDLKDKTVFEWGSGQSSLYFAKKVKKITSIEHDLSWYEKGLESKLDNMEIRICDLKEDYPNAINLTEELYDIIVIDGEIYSRIECARQCENKLRPGGFIILDNSDWLTNTAALLRSYNLIQVDMAGIGPINPYLSCTTFFFHREFNCSSANSKHPQFVPGGLRNIRD